MKDRKKKLLVIAYAFPPHSIVGSMRPLRMVKYLKEASGWIPYILTVNREFDHNDYSLLDEVPKDVSIYRTGIIEPAFWLERMRQAVMPFYSYQKRSVLDHLRKMLSKTFSLLSELSSIPDAQLFWNFPVVDNGRRIIKTEGIDAVLVTSPPWSLQIAGFMLKRITGVPWIVDYRDPWTDIRRKNRPSFVDACEQWLEKVLLEQADLVLSTSDTYTNDLAKKFPTKNSDKFHTLHNGFDEEKFKECQIRRGNNRFTIAHLGTMYSLFNPYVFLDTLKKWITENNEVGPRIELLFVGGINDQTRKAIDESGLSHVTKVTGFVPHRDAISLCARADLLLLSMGIEGGMPKGWLPSKLFEYLALERPILAYTVDGEASAMLRTVNRGNIVTVTDHCQVVEFLNCLFQRKWQDPNLYIPWHNKPELMETIRQAYIMKRLGDLLDSITK